MNKTHEMGFIFFQSNMIIAQGSKTYVKQFTDMLIFQQ